MTTPISDERAQKMTEEYQQLMAIAVKQLDEHKVWLKDRIAALTSMTSFDRATLAYQVDRIELETVYAEPNVTQLLYEDGVLVPKKTMSLVWQYPDELIAFLTSDLATEELRNTLDGANFHSEEDQPAFHLKKATDAEVQAEAEKARAQRDTP